MSKITMEALMFPEKAPTDVWGICKEMLIVLVIIGSFWGVVFYAILKTFGIL